MSPLEMLRHHVTAAIERGEDPVEEVRFKREPIDEATARRRLERRWLEQVELYPRMRETAPLALYIRRNLRVTMRDGLLAGYES